MLSGDDERHCLGAYVAADIERLQPRQDALGEQVKIAPG
jgi:hypothetical protein